MREETLKFGDIVVNKKEFHASKQPIALNLVNTSIIVVSEKFKHSDDAFKYFIGYLHDNDVIKTLCIILPQMSGYIKYFGNGGKNMSFKIEDKDVYLKYTEIWNKIYPQIYLERCKYKIKIRQPVDFIDAEVDLSSDNSDDLDDK